MLESVYIDNDASGNLNPGDRVWGTDPFDLTGACFDSLGTSQIVDWDAIAAIAGGSIIYQGGPEAFRSEAGSEPGPMIKNYIIVDADGYDGLQ